MDVALVGTGGMMPLPERWLASVLVRYESDLILFDCGEGTQVSLRELGWGLKAIGVILISHLHADHVGGIAGLLLTLGNSGRTEPVDVYGPPGLTAVVDGLTVVARYLPFEVRCHELSGGEQFHFGDLTCTAAAADHSVPCVAYRLDVARQPRFLPDRAAALRVPVELWSVLQHGEAVTVGGQTIEPSQVLGPPRPGLAVALMTDTRPTEALRSLAEGVDLLVCEGTYGRGEDQPRAVERKHMTFAEAATLARDARARRLVLSHFSPSVTHPAEYAGEARAVFPETQVGHDHLTVRLSFLDD